MLKTLEINNIALIEHVELSFDNGLTVLSGETGSGKSIIIDSLAFVLGERADKTLIKHGEEFADVTAVFEVEKDSPVVQKLVENGFGDDTEILLCRKMSVSGRNEIRIQGKTATLQMLKSICEELVDIFGQSEHLNLLSENNQLSAVDGFCNFNGLDTQLKDKLYPQLRNIETELSAFGGSDAERERLADILKYQIDEIESAELSTDEEEELERQHKRIINAEKITNALSMAVGALQDECGAVNALASAVGALHGISGVDTENDSLAERLTSVRIETEDVLESLNAQLEKTEFSSEEIDKIELRRDKIRTLKRKYGGSIEDVLAFLEKIKIDYDKLVNSAQKIEQLAFERQSVLKQMYDVACKMSAIRKNVADELSLKIVSELADLGMNGTTFEVSFEATPVFEEYCKHVSPCGFDKLQFLMSANVGEPLKPLNKVISGGEMSRFMLAVKNITALAEKIPTMVFDEIDTGVSGNMASKVAQKLANVASESYQCIVITHLPQICAMADENMLIQKCLIGEKTQTSVSVLASSREKALEVARLMGGVGEHLLTSAEELVDWSNTYKSNIRKHRNV